MSPLVTETNLTWCPLAAHRAAAPAAFSSQSSGWAPKQMMRSLPSSGGMGGRAAAWAAASTAATGGTRLGSDAWVHSRPTPRPPPKQTVATIHRCARFMRYLPFQWGGGTDRRLPEGRADRHDSLPVHEHEIMMPAAAGNTTDSVRGTQRQKD